MNIHPRERKVILDTLEDLDRARPWHFLDLLHEVARLSHCPVYVAAWGVAGSPILATLKTRFPVVFKRGAGHLVSLPLKPNVVLTGAQVKALIGVAPGHTHHGSPRLLPGT